MSRLSNACLNNALRILTRRDHSCAELVKKLRMRGFEAQEIQDTISTCLSLGYLNDERVAHAYLRQLQKKGYGSNAIKHKLYSKGISKDLIEACIASQCTDENELRACQQALEKKIRYLKGDKSFCRLRPKLQRFLFGRGFSSQTIYRAMDEANTRKE